MMILVALLKFYIAFIKFQSTYERQEILFFPFSTIFIKKFNVKRTKCTGKKYARYLRNVLIHIYKNMLLGEFYNNHELLLIFLIYEN